MIKRFLLIITMFVLPVAGCLAAGKKKAASAQISDEFKAFNEDKSELFMIFPIRRASIGVT